MVGADTFIITAAGHEATDLRSQGSLERLSIKPGKGMETLCVK